MLQRLCNSKSDGLAILALGGLPFAYFWQATFRQAVFFFGDILLFFYPTHLAYATALREGRLPLWEPRMLTGFPLFAEGQIGALYPTHPLLYGLLPIDVATNYDILISLAWVAVGMYLFLRALKLAPASAFLGALAFGFGGFFVARLQHMSILATASWLPWLFWAFEKHEQESDPRKRLRWWVVLALCGGIQLLGGHPQFALMTAVLLGLYSSVRWQRGENAPAYLSLRGARAKRQLNVVESQERATKQSRLADLAQFPSWLAQYFDPLRAVVVVTALGVGAWLAAAQLAPTFELSTLSDRAAGLLPKFFNAFSLRPVHYLMLFNPFILGNPYPFVSVEVIGYIGLLPLGLGMSAPFVRRNRRVVFFAAIALVALFLGLGDQNIFYRGLRYLPLFNYFRVPSRFFFWFSFAAAVLAASAFDYFLQRAPATLRLTRGQKIALAFFALLFAVIVGLVPALPIDFWLDLWVWLPIIFAAGTAWFVLGARRGLFTRPTLITLAAGLTLIDLALFAAVYTKTYDALTPVDDFYKPPSTLSIVQDVSLSDGRALTSLWIYPVMITMRESLYPNVFLIYNVPNAMGYTPLIPERISRYLDNLTAPLVDLSNVRYYIKPQMLPVDPLTEGKDMANEFAPDFLNHTLPFTPTRTSKLQITSSLAQSVNLRDGAVVAEIHLVTQDGTLLVFPLRAGYDTAEWAYERSDVRKIIQQTLPPIATTFPARSAFPTEAHPGHTYLAQFDLTQDGEPIDVSSITISPKIPSGLLHIERVALVTPEGRALSLAQLTDRSDQTLVYRTNEVAVFRNEDQLARAFLVHSARVVDDSTALKEISRDDFKPFQQSVLAAGAPLQNGGAQLAGESVRIDNYQPERVTLSVQAQADAYLLLADAWYPGWVARVDGIETPIQRADYIFRAVRVSAGAHHIEFVYKPTAFYAGIIGSVTALLLLGGVLVWSRRRSPASVLRSRQPVV